MPKLDKKTAQAVDETEGSSFEAVPEGPYVASLAQVEVREGPAGPYWSWEFTVADGEHENRKLWVNTSLAENARWKMQEVFKAFNVPADTDTDDLVGQVVKLIVTQRVIERGARAGQVGNNVDSVLPVNAADVGGGDGEVW